MRFQLAVAARMLAVSACVAVVSSAVASPHTHQDAAKKKGSSSWKIPPAAPSPNKAPESTPETLPSGTTAPNPTSRPEGSGSGLGELARLARFERAKAGQESPWDESVHVFLSSPTTAIVPVVRFESASSPSVVRVGEACACFFVQYPKDDAEGFARLMCATADAEATSWRTPVRVVVDGVPDEIEAPLHPSIVAGPGAALTLCFLGRTTQDATPHTLLMCAQSVDGGRTFTADAERLDLGAIDATDLSCFAHAGRTHAFVAVRGERGLQHASRANARAPFERKPSITLADAGEWRGGCAASTSGAMEYLGAGTAGSPPWRAHASGALGAWTLVARNDETPALTTDDATAVDLAATEMSQDNLRLTAAVFVTPESSGLPSTPPADVPESGPIASEESQPEAAPSARKITDPIPAPRGLEAQPIGAKRPPPTRTVPGPTAPPIGGRP